MLDADLAALYGVTWRIDETTLRRTGAGNEKYAQHGFVGAAGRKSARVCIL